MTIELRPFQEKALVQYRASFARGGNSHLGIAPTAFGKSILMGYLASKMCPTGWRVVIVAHREALIDQNAKKVSRVDATLKVGREMAKDKADPTSDVISASIQTIQGERQAKCIEAWRADGRKIFLMTDEAHHALAPSYRELIEALKPDKHLGLTATPFRGDGESLEEIFPEVGFQISRGEMIDDGWLAKPIHYCQRTQVSLGEVKSKAGDYVESQLAKAINVESRNHLIITIAKEIRDDWMKSIEQQWFRGVCFSINVEHAHVLEQLFREAGFEAYAISAKTPIPERRAADERLRKGEAHVVLISCGVLTEGWDVEECNVGIFARPTKSNVLADQMLGRVLRWKADKKKSFVIDFEDSEAGDRVPISASFGLPPRWDARGRCLREDELWFREIYANSSLIAQSNMWRCLDRFDVEAILKNPDSYYARMLPDRDKQWWDLGIEFRMIVNAETIVVYQRSQGDWVAEQRLGEARTEIAAAPIRDIVLSKAESWVDYHRPQAFTRAWYSSEPPTKEQLDQCKRWKVNIPPDATKKTVSDLLSYEKMARNRLLENGVWAIGKHKGKKITELPDYYVRYILENRMGTRENLEILTAEGERRGLTIVIKARSEAGLGGEEDQFGAAY